MAKELIAYLKLMTQEVKEYSDDLVRGLLEKIIVNAVKNPVLIAPSFQKSGTVDSCRTVPVGSIHLLGDYTLLTNQVKAASHRMATRP